MAGKVAIITGAGGGIGRAIAVELSKRKRGSYSLLLVGRTEKSLRETQKHVQSAQIFVADVSKPESAAKIVKYALSHFGRIDALINNAGTAPVLSIEQTTPRIWRETVETNLSAAFYLARAVWPTFKAQQCGMVVNISSMAARDPFQGFAAYGSAKAGLNNLGITLAREGEPIGVRVYTIAPGAVETPMLRSILSKEQLPEGQTLSPGTVALAVWDCVTGKKNYQSGGVIWLARGNIADAS